MPKAYKQFVSLTKTNIRVRTYTFLTITFILLAVLLFFAIRPTILTIFDINEKSKDLTGTYEALVEKNTKLAKIKTQLESTAPTGVKDSVEFFKSESIPTKDDSLFLAANIDLISKDASVLLTGFSPSTSNEKFLEAAKITLPTNLKAKQVTVTVDGRSISDINNFITKLQGFARINKINTVLIKQNLTGNSKDFPYTGSVNFIIFYKNTLTNTNKTNV